MCHPYQHIPASCANDVAYCRRVPPLCTIGICISRGQRIDVRDIPLDQVPDKTPPTVGLQDSTRRRLLASLFGIHQLEAVPPGALRSVHIPSVVLSIWRLLRPGMSPWLVPRLADLLPARPPTPDPLPSRRPVDPADVLSPNFSRISLLGDRQEEARCLPSAPIFGG